MLIKSPHTTLYLLPIAMFALSVTVCEVLSIELCMTFTLTFGFFYGPRSNINMPLERPHATFCVVNSNVECVTICELIAHGRRKVLDSNLWSWKWRSRMLAIWKKIGARMYLINWHMFAKMCASKSGCSRYITVDFVRNERTDVLPARLKRCKTIGRTRKRKITRRSTVFGQTQFLRPS